MSLPSPPPGRERQRSHPSREGVGGEDGERAASARRHASVMAQVVEGDDDPACVAGALVGIRQHSEAPRFLKL